ncbi:9466_t:CDS:1, partial [Ambispora leptoticha]
EDRYFEESKKEGFEGEFKPDFKSSFRRARPERKDDPSDQGNADRGDGIVRSSSSWSS